MHPSRAILTRALSATAVAAVFAAPHLVRGQTLPAVRNCMIVTMTSLRNSNGLVRMGIYDDPHRWPQPEGALYSCVARIQGNSASCGFEPLRPGTDYAVAASHDENNNGRFDQNIVGAPLEGFGFTNDATPMLAPPSWDDAKVRFTGGIVRQVIHAQY